MTHLERAKKTMKLPSWKHRRRLIYLSYLVSVLMIVSGITIREFEEVARELIIGGVALITIILTAYTAFATLDDKWHFKEEE
jgi:polyferredoxin